MKQTLGRKHVVVDDEVKERDDENMGGTEDETELEDDTYQKPTIHIKNPYALRTRLDSTASAKASAKSAGLT